MATAEKKKTVTMADLNRLHEKLAELKECVICGGQYSGWGNNAAPFFQPGGRCCDNCNRIFVIPARLSRMGNGKGW